MHTCAAGRDERYARPRFLVFRVRWAAMGGSAKELLDRSLQSTIKHTTTCRSEVHVETDPQDDVITPGLVTHIVL